MFEGFSCICFMELFAEGALGVLEDFVLGILNVFHFFPRGGACARVLAAFFFCVFRFFCLESRVSLGSCGFHGLLCH